MTFKSLLGVKLDEIQTLRNRYIIGLEKLEFAASQVSIMQAELQDLQPELIKTSAETEKLMIKIEQDTVEVEAKKEVWCQYSNSNWKTKNICIYLIHHIMKEILIVFWICPVST